MPAANIFDNQETAASGEAIVDKVLGTAYKKVRTVYENLDNIEIVANNITDISAVEDNLVSINTVAGSIDSVNAVAAIDENVSTVANNTMDVSIVAINIDSVNTVADNAALLLPATQAVTQAIDGRKDLFLLGSDYVSGVTTQLTLTQVPAKSETVKVFFNGIYQNSDTWFRVGTVITFNVPITVDSVEVQYEIPSQFLGLNVSDNDVLVAAQNAAQTSANISTTQAGIATTARTGAEAARDSSFANAKGAATIADARALVADTETFIVYAPGALTFTAYRRTSSTTQVFLGDFPSAASVSDLSVITSASIDATAGVACEITDSDGGVIAEITEDGSMVVRSVQILDSSKVPAEITSLGGTIVMPETNLGGCLFSEIDDPGFAVVITDDEGAVIAQVFDDSEKVSDPALVAQIGFVNSAKPRFTSRRPAVLSLIFDDLNPTDEAVMGLLEARVLRAGFALNCANVSSNSIRLYQEAYCRGHSILSHSIDAVAMSSGALSASVVEAKMADSKKILESYGFKISGWVTPSSVLHSSYFAALRKYYGYAFTYSSALGWDANIDPTSLARKGIETLLDTDNGTFGGHNIAAVTSDMASAVTAGNLRVYYCHGVPSAYYTNADLTPRPSVAEIEAILDYMVTLRDTGQALILPPDEALALYYKPTIV